MSWGILCRGCGQLWDCHYGPLTLCHHPRHKKQDTYQAGDKLPMTTPCSGCGLSYQSHMSAHGISSARCTKPLDPDYPYYTVGKRHESALAQPKSTICPCGITRVDCDYHR